MKHILSLFLMIALIGFVLAGHKAVNDEEEGAGATVNRAAKKGRSDADSEAEAASDTANSEGRGGSDFVKDMVEMPMGLVKTGVKTVGNMMGGFMGAFGGENHKKRTE